MIVALDIEKKVNGPVSACAFTSSRFAPARGLGLPGAPENRAFPRANLAKRGSARSTPAVSRPSAGSPGLPPPGL